MKECDTSSYPLLPIGAALATFLITVTTASISCTIVNIKLLKDNTCLKKQLKSMPRQRTDKMEEDLTRDSTEEVDIIHQASTHRDIDTDSNPAYIQLSV